MPMGEWVLTFAELRHNWLASKKRANSGQGGGMGAKSVKQIKWTEHWGLMSLQ